MDEEQDCAVTHFSFIIAGIVQLYNCIRSPFCIYMTVHKVSAGLGKQLFPKCMVEMEPKIINKHYKY